MVEGVRFQQFGGRIVSLFRSEVVQDDAEARWASEMTTMGKGMLYLLDCLIR